jgi:hypothetical protein
MRTKNWGEAICEASAEVESWAGVGRGDGLELTINGRDYQPVSPVALYLVRLALREHLGEHVKITITNGRGGEKVQA